jgi:CBS domain-containing protein
VLEGEEEASMRNVRSVMTRDPVTLSAAATLRDALELMEGGSIRHLPVVEEGRVVGILSDLDLRAWRQAWLDARGAEGSELAQALLATPVSQRMTTALTCVEADAPLLDAVDGLLERRVGALPVLEGGRLVGIVSVVDVLGAVRDQLDGSAEETELGPERVADRMTTEVIVTSRSERLADAMRLMADHDVRHLPVVDEERSVVGVISHRDLIAEGRRRTRVDESGEVVVLGRSLPDRAVQEAMTLAETVDPEAPLAEAARKMLEGGLGCLPVVNHLGELVGILTATDFVKATAEAA